LSILESIPKKLHQMM